LTLQGVRWQAAQRATDGRCLGVSQKKLTASVEDKRALLDLAHPDLSIRRQCALLGLNRASYYYQATSISPLNLDLLRRIDQQYMAPPFYGVPRMTAVLRAQGYAVNRKRVQRLMRQLGIQAVMLRKRPATSTSGHRIYPYLLRDRPIKAPNEVWCADITYVPMPLGFVYLVAIMDWFSRYIVAWEIATSLEGSFCCTALERALGHGRPTIFNTDQGSQFTAQAFTSRLETAGVQISMDGRGRVFDNIFIERFWRSVKYEHLYLHDYQTVPAVVAGVQDYMDFYNTRRLHQSLAYQTPAAVYGSG
jgi:putative transposase